MTVYSTIRLLIQVLLLTLLILVTQSHIANNSSEINLSEDYSKIIFEEVHEEFSFSSIIDIQFLDYQGDLIFIVSQQGLISYVNRSLTNPQKSTFIDISGLVEYGGEKGLLGLTFHPDFSSNGKFYVDYTAPDPLRTVISEYSANPFTLAVNETTVRTILEVDQPYDNHNAGAIAFGPDGYLYVTLGDGGSGGDPLGNGQNVGNLLGSILRVDVNTVTQDKNYSIPSDNPFTSTQDALDEIWAYGLRNPWRISFDKQTGVLFVGDVGQNTWEEINVVESGKNYGWNVMEGPECYGTDSCITEGLEYPIVSYSRDDGISVTGGYVYRGSNSTSLFGKYLFGDYGSGNIWAMSLGNEYQYTKIASTGYPISTFGQDANGEVYFASLTGEIYQFFEISSNKSSSEGIPKGGVTTSNTTLDKMGEESSDLFSLKVNLSHPIFMFAIYLLIRWKFKR